MEYMPDTYTAILSSVASTPTCGRMPVAVESATLSSVALILTCGHMPVAVESAVQVPTGTPGSRAAAVGLRVEKTGQSRAGRCRE